MSKIDWDVYAQRRRINLDKLIETQGLKSYSDYLMFCLTINVNPMSEEDFPLSNTKKVPATEKSPAKVAVTKTTPTKRAPKSPAKTEGAPDDRWGIKKTKGSSKKTTKKIGK
jgi:hypothetical protein